MAGRIPIYRLVGASCARRGGAGGAAAEVSASVVSHHCMSARSGWVSGVSWAASLLLSVAAAVASAGSAAGEVRTARRTDTNEPGCPAGTYGLVRVSPAGTSRRRENRGRVARRRRCLLGM
jgi:hypothetical protein